MSLIKRPNRLPNNTEVTTLNELIAQEEAILVSIQKLEKERKEARWRLLSKSSLLQRTLQSTKAIQDVASQMASSNGPLLRKLEKEIASQEADVSALSAVFPSTRDFMKGVKAIILYAALLQATLERQLRCIGDRVNSVDEQLESTVDLEAYMFDAVSSASTVISTVEDTIKKKRQGLLHPIRRLPAEMLEEIFQVCINKETQGWLDDPSILPDPPKAATSVASVCRSWRSVALQCPRLWRCLRAPVQSTRYDRYGYGRTVTAGVDHFRNSLRLCGNLAIELTIPHQASIPNDIDITAIPLDRLNLLDVWNQWPPTTCSPLHLWMSQPSRNGSLTREIPSSLLSRTKTITAFSVSITFEAPSRSVNHLIISGRQPTVPFIPLLTSLPNLEELDVKDAQIYEAPDAGSRQTLSHPRLRCIRLHSSCLETLEQSLSDGLQLLRLRSLTLSDLTSQNDPLLYPFISAQLSATVTSLDIHGTETTDATIVRSFIDKFHRVNTLSASGTAVSSVLCALYDSTGDILRVQEMPKGLETAIIQDYKGDGSALHQNLQMIDSSPATGTRPITIIFEGCPNIRKDIKEEFALAGPMIVIEPPDRDLGPYSDPYGSTQLSDHLLDELDAADGWE